MTKQQLNNLIDDRLNLASSLFWHAVQLRDDGMTYESRIVARHARHARCRACLLSKANVRTTG